LIVNNCGGSLFGGLVMAIRALFGCSRELSLFATENASSIESGKTFYFGGFLSSFVVIHGQQLLMQQRFFLILPPKPC